MRILPQIILLIIICVFTALGQSPHGDDFDIDCSFCHQETDWKVIPRLVTFDHSATDFPLIGGHKTVDCKSCHTTLKFKEDKTDCISCHTDIHQGTVGMDCAKCHTSKSWMVEDINQLHQFGRFPLLGKHLIADCVQCHSRYVDLYFEPLNIECIACHANDFQVGHSPGDPTNCEECHSISSFEWSSINVDHDFFPLVGGHAISDCFACHEPGGDYGSISPECVSCHQDDYNATTNPNHIAENFPTDCEQCHSINGWIPSNFNHNNTNFPLTGAHIATDCISCHTQGYTGTPSECVSCHQDDYNATTDPNHVASSFPTECAVCHSTTAWEPAEFNHDLTSFPLTGQHVSVDCTACHTSGYTGTPAECVACHQDDYNNTTDPNHTTSGIPTTCESCHTTSGWTPASFDHSFYPISSHHNNVTCNECHSETNYQPQCINCHQDDFNEGHNAGDPIDCWGCHSTSDWDSGFDHNATNFPLTGAHVALACLDCHESGYQGTPLECIACHQDNYNNTTNPSHATLQLPTDCVMCHTTDPNWIPATFPIHDQFFVLTGAHANITDCNSCHNGNYNSTPNTCIGCHQNDYNGTIDPPHQILNFSVDCLECHNMNGWTPANFDHSFYPTGSNHNNVNCNECHSETNYGPQCLSCHQDDFLEGHNAGDPTDCWSCHSTSDWDSGFNHNNTNFPLTGAHVGLACLDCHEGGYQGTPTECVACHQDNFNNSTNPSHTTLQLPTDCVMCHTTDPGWAPATFPIHDQFFQLIGAHANITDCNSCHNGNYNSTPNTCIGCHQNDYNGTIDPPHQILNFSVDCLECHDMNGWTPANFDHSFYPTGSNHNNVNCNECHSETNYGPQCLSCHQDDFLEGHNAGDPTDCWNCHSTSNWDSNFDHNNTNFPLTGAHIGVACLDCHESGYQGTPLECIACHQDNYNNTTNPSHATLQLPTDCVMCHTTDPNWIPATFPIHDQFFVLTGAHANITDCNSCHNGNYNSTPNTCIGCHQNDYNGTVDPPHQILNFSVDCLECHNMNGWTPANFDHSFYPTGSNHNNVNCNECHSETNYGPQCLSCHQDDFLEEHNVGDPTDCWNCHSTSDWDVNGPGPGRIKIQESI